MKKNHTVTVLMLAGVLLYSAASLMSASSQLKDAVNLTQELTRKIENAEKENLALSERVRSIGSEQSVKSEAEEFFGFTDPHGFVFIDED